MNTIHRNEFHFGNGSFKSYSCCPANDLTPIYIQINIDIYVRRGARHPLATCVRRNRDASLEQAVITGLNFKENGGR